MKKFQERTEQALGLGQNVGVRFGTVWKVFDDNNGQLVTTSGRINTSTLQDTIDSVKTFYTNRLADYNFVLDGIVVALLHPNDTQNLI